MTFNARRRPAALQFYVDMITNKVQPPVGQYDREAGVSLFKAGRIGFLHDEPLRLAVFRDEKLPFKWDFINPVGVGSKRTIFSTTGHWVMASKGKNKDAAWDFVKFLSSPAFANGVRPALRLGARPQRRQHEQGPATGKNDAQVQRDQRLRPEGLGRPAHRAEDGAAHGRLRSGDRGGGQRQDVGQGCPGQGADGRHRDPEELAVETRGTRAKEDVGGSDRGAWDQLTLSPEQYRRAGAGTGGGAAGVAYLFLLPYFIPFLAFLVVPVFWSIYLSLQQGRAARLRQVGRLRRTGGRSPPTRS